VGSNQPLQIKHINDELISALTDHQ